MDAVFHVCRRLRGFFVLLFLCALICAQSASLASQHSHNRSEHCCGLCHVGPLPLLQPAASTGFAPILSVAWLSPSHDLDSPGDALLTAGSSRAPPFSLPV
jgi:hypothetical protein